jgi:D-threo-aldose 1-dehydrogenase
MLTLRSAGWRLAPAAASVATIRGREADDPMVTAGIRIVRLGDTRIETTALGFGCADLFREPGRARRRRLLDEAFDAGIRHFDAAPMYGLGLVEGEIGRFARGKRDRIVIATKFGIEPAPAARLIAGVQGVARRVLGRLPALGERARPAGVDPRSGLVGALLYRPGDYGARAARASLERSLRQLRTDHIDVLFLHDPAPGAAISEDVAAYLESARSAGHIRAWGIAGEAAPAGLAAQRLARPVPILQIRQDVFSRMSPEFAAAGTRPSIVFGVIARALPRIVRHVRSSDRVRRRWSGEVGADCSRFDEIAALLLRDALRANAVGTVLFSTIHGERIERAAVAARAAIGPDPGVDAFRALVGAELAGREAQP